MMGIERKPKKKKLTWYSHGSILGIISKTTMSMRNNQMQKQDTNSKNKQQKKTGLGSNSSCYR